MQFNNLNNRGANTVANSAPVSIATDDPKFTNPNTATFTSVAGAVASTTLLAANAGRQGAIFFNDSTSGTLFLRLGAVVATATNYSVVLLPGGSFVLGRDDYRGEVRGIWSAATGFVNITELTA